MGSRVRACRLIAVLPLVAGFAQAQISISPGSLPDGFVGSSYGTQNTSGCSYTSPAVGVAASGGQGPYTFSLVGSGPPGVSLGSNGVFSGAPSQSGTFSFSVRAQDSLGAIGSRNYSIRVRSVPGCGPLRAFVGSTAFFNFFCNDPASTYSSPGGAFPPGLSLNSSTGAVSGVPTQAGQFSAEWQCVGSDTQLRLRLDFDVGAQPSGTFAAVVGQPVDVGYTLNGGTAPFSFAVVSGSLPPGLAHSPSQARITGTPTQQGSFQATVVRTDADGFIITLNVVFQVDPAAAGGPVLTATPTTLAYSFDSDGGGSPDAGVQVQTTSPQPVNFSAEASTDSGGAWLRVENGQGTVSAGQSARFGTRADPAALQPGVYTGAVTITGGATPVVIPATMTIRRFESQLTLSQDGVAVEVQEGATPLTRTFFQVGDEGNSPNGIDWTARAETRTGGEWLQPTQTSGNTNDLVSGGVGAAINPAGLSPGSYYGLIEVEAPGAGNSPQQATVTLVVKARGENVQPALSPQGAIAVAEEGSNTTVQQFFDVSNPNAEAVSFTASASTDSGGDWLEAGSGATLSPGQRLGYFVRINAAGLERGVYRGRATLSFSNGTSADFRIALVVTPLGALGSPLSKEREKAQGVCTPNQNVPVFTGIGGGGPPTTGLAQPITVQVVDNCGNPVTSGTATTTLTGSTTTTTPMQSVGGGFGGTWTPPPGESGSTVNATVTVDTTGGVTGSSSESVPVQPNPQPPPVVAEGGVVHAASFAPEPLAPGAMISIFGSDLSAATLNSGGTPAPSLPLPEELASTRVTIADAPVPLLFAREDQINAILPFELGDRATEALPLIVERTDSGAVSTVARISLAAARPGVFPGSVLDQQFRLVNAENPATAGDAVQVFAAGLGLVDQPVATGSAAGADPLARTVETVRVTVSGVEAQVLFAGLSPGFAGLFQVNFFVPSGVPAGEVDLVVFAGGQPSQTTTIVVR